MSSHATALHSIRQMSVEELLQEIEISKQRDAEIETKLVGLFGTRTQLEKQLVSLESTIPNLKESDAVAEKAHERIDYTAVLAHNIAKQVRQLDIAQARLRSVVNRVENALDLTSALSHARELLERRDWEAGAQCTFKALHNGRAQSRLLASTPRVQNLASPAAALRGSALDSDPSRLQLVEVERQMGVAILADCHAASAKNDHKQVWRLARLLPLVDRALEGIDLYCKHVRAALREELTKRALTIESQPKGAVIPFLDLAAGSFDLITTTLAAHRAAVDRHFGTGASMLLLQCIQSECDALLQPLIARFAQERRLTSLIKEARARKMSSSADEAFSMDPRRLDGLLDEVAFLAREVELFDRDIRQLGATATGQLNQVADDAPATATVQTVSDQPDDVAQRYRARRLLEQLTQRSNKAGIQASCAAIPALMHVSRLNEVSQELTGQLISLEELYMIENVKRAISMDEPVPVDADGGPGNDDDVLKKAAPNTEAAAPTYAPNTSAVDDVFFVLRKSAERAFSTCNVSVGCAVLNHVNSIMSRELRQSLELGVRAALGDSNAAHTLRAARVSQFEPPSTHALPFALNNLECAARYTVQLGDQLSVTFQDLFAQRAEEQTMLKHCLDDVRHAAAAFRRLLDDFFTQVSRAGGSGGAGEIISGRARRALDTWAHLAYELSEGDYTKVQQTAAAAVSSASLAAATRGYGDETHDDDEDTESTQNAVVSSESVVHAILAAIDQRLRPMKSLLSEDNFDSLTHAVVQFLAKRIEELILKKKFTFWGGLQLDKDIRTLMNYFASICQRTARDKFSRLVQICSVLQLEKISEISDYFSDNRAVWRLEASEVRRVLALRSDFSQKAISQLRL